MHLLINAIRVTRKAVGQNNLKRLCYVSEQVLVGSFYANPGVLMYDCRVVTVNFFGQSLLP